MLFLDWGLTDASHVALRKIVMKRFLWLSHFSMELAYVRDSYDNVENWSILKSTFKLTCSQWRTRWRIVDLKGLILFFLLFVKKKKSYVCDNKCKLYIHNLYKGLIVFYLPRIWKQRSRLNFSKAA